MDSPFVRTTVTAIAAAGLAMGMSSLPSGFRARLRKPRSPVPATPIELRADGTAS